MTPPADYVIVGAGSAGCVLAARLSEKPSVRVVLLEAGPIDSHPFIHIPLGLGRLHARRMYDWQFTSEPESELCGRRIHAPRGKVLGGSSSINVMGYTRGDRADYDGWAANGLSGWGWDDVLPHFVRSETWEEGASESRGGDGPVGVERARVRDPIWHAWLEAARAQGFMVRPDLNCGDSEGFSRLQFTIRSGRRSSSAAAYLRPALRRANLDVRVGAVAQRLSFDGRRAVGVRYVRNGEAQEVRALREVVVCAGAFNTPQLLMLSGIGPAEHLRELDIEVVRDAPVGANLQDHPAVVVMYARRQAGEFHRQMRADRMLWALCRAQVMRTGFASTMPSGVIGFVRSTVGASAPDVEFMFPVAPPDARLWFPGVRSAYRDAFGIRPVVLHPKSRGRVRLRSTHAEDTVAIQFNLLADPADVTLLRESVRIGREIARRWPMNPYRGEELVPGMQVSDDETLDAYIRQSVITAHHPCGTCAMGADKGAVLDEQLRVRGVAGLRVVDASAMPSLVSAHINACVLMMAEKASDLIGR